MIIKSICRRLHLGLWRMRRRRTWIANPAQKNKKLLTLITKIVIFILQIVRTSLTLTNHYKALMKRNSQYNPKQQASRWSKTTSTFSKQTIQIVRFNTLVINQLIKVKLNQRFWYQLYWKQLIKTSWLKMFQHSM